MNILSEILARKKREIASLSFNHMVNSPKQSFISAVISKHPSLIAEVKPVSPIRGRLINTTDIPAMIELYQRHAQAISVLCDTATFGGGFDLLASIRVQTDLPLLAKDFILDNRQIDAAAAYGADAVLLIASILSREDLLQFSKRAIGMGMDVLLELHEPSEIDAAALLARSLTTEERLHILFGINNRSLKTQIIDLNITKQLGKLIRQRLPHTLPLISESGIHSPEDVQQLSAHVQGFLIGSAILESFDPGLFLSSLFPSS